MRFFHTKFDKKITGCKVTTFLAYTQYYDTKNICLKCQDEEFYSKRTNNLFKTAFLLVHVKKKYYLCAQF